MKSTYKVTSKSSNSFAGFAVGVLVTGLLFGGYEASQSDLLAEAIHSAAAVQASPQEPVKFDTVVVTAKRLHKA